MRRRRILAVGVAGAFVACEFTPPGPGILPTPDAGPCASAPSTECADNTTLRTCSVVDEAPIDTPCAWGCLSSGSAHCGTLLPAANAAVALDLDPASFAGLDDATLASGDTINGDTGVISGAGVGVFFYEQRAENTIGLFRFKSLRVTGPIRLIGQRAVVLVAEGTIDINGIITAKGTCGADGMAITPGPGGFAGASASSARGGGEGGGFGGLNNTAGGGGGGNGGSGGGGANTGPNGGPTSGTETIDLLEGGAGGGAGAGGGFGRGGGGGGAIQIISNTAIVIGAEGGINAGGCGGDGGGGGGSDGGGGGGAGGTILLEAPEVSGAGKLAVNGGGGGGGDNSGAGGLGVSGSLDRGSASGGAGGNGGGSGGTGAAASTSDGGLGGVGQNGAGGGGAIGRIRINTRTGASGITGEMSPAIEDNTTAKAAAATVQ
jgi:hypothetical protein